MEIKDLSDYISYTKIIKAKQYSKGSVYLLYMTNEMWMVVEFDDQNKMRNSRPFCYNERIKHYVWKDCLGYYNNIKSFLINKKDV